ncbi:MAG: putative zinc-binding metallopeptidase [Tepidisphaeraceae bacterium]
MRRLALIVGACLLVAVAGWLGVGVGKRSRDPEIATLRDELTKASDAAKVQLAKQEKQLRKEAEDQRRRDFKKLSREVEAQRQRRDLEDRLGLRITGAAEDFEAPPLLSPGDKWHGRAISLDQTLAALDVVTEEMSLYPDSVYRLTGLSRVVLAQKLQTSMFGLKGFCTIYRVMYLDATLPPDELARTFHHELFHLIDQSILKRRMEDDTEWKGLNAPSPGYSTDQELLSDTTWGRKALAERRGFVSAYSRWSAAEDKAEMFEWMAYRPNALDFRADGDNVLQAKRKLLSARLLKWNPDLNDTLWANARDRESRRRE